MKKLIYISALVISCFACEKIIDYDLIDAESQIVIEAKVTAITDSCMVKISQTGSYFNDYEPQLISGAKVYMENGDKTFSFVETEDGIYKPKGLKGLEYGTCKMLVQIDDVVYEAESELLKPVRLEYLSWEKELETETITGNYSLYYAFHDPIDVANYYRVRYMQNGVCINTSGHFNIFVDEMFDGKSIQMKVTGHRFWSGDKVTVELMSIDEKVFQYFSTLEDVLDTDITTTMTPTNPESNFSNGALGYFSAVSSSQMTAIIGRKDY